MGVLSMIDFAGNIARWIRRAMERKYFSAAKD